VRLNGLLTKSSMTYHLRKTVGTCTFTCPIDALQFAIEEDFYEKANSNLIFNFELLFFILSLISTNKLVIYFFILL